MKNQKTMNDKISDLEMALNLVRNCLVDNRTSVQNYKSMVEILDREGEQLVIAEKAIATGLEMERSNFLEKLDIEANKEVDSTLQKDIISEAQYQVIKFAEDSPKLRPTRITWDEKRFSTAAIKSFSEEEFVNNLPIEIKPDEFKEGSILETSIAILRKFKEPLHKKKLAVCIIRGGKTNESKDFLETVKSSLKDYTSSDGPLLVKNGFYFLREWDLSQWGLEQDGTPIV